MKWNEKSPKPFSESPVKADLLSELKSTNMESGAIAYIRQHQAMGLGHAEIYDAELETLAREAYAADYTNFGFEPLEI